MNLGNKILLQKNSSSPLKKWILT